MSKHLAHRKARPEQSVLAFDVHPIRMEGFHLQSRGVKVVGKPTLKQWIAAMQFAVAAEQASPYWVGDLLAHSEDRDDWKDKIDQAMHLTGISRKTAYNLTYISKSVEEPERRIAPSISHAAEVAALPREEQTEWLQKARDEDLTRHELRKHIKGAKRTKIIEGQAVLEGVYRVWLADPPWSYSDSGSTADGSLAKAEDAYPTMSMEELIKLPVQAHTGQDAIMFMWVTASMLYENPGPREVLEAWGFKPKSGIVWDKVLGMPGHYGLQVKHEHVIIATRGSCLPDVPLPHDDSVMVVRRKGEHSEKPEELRQFIDKHWTLGKRVELFGRKRVKNWDVFGHDARLWT